MEKNEEIIDKELLSEISDYDGIRKGAYNIRKTGFEEWNDGKGIIGWHN